MVAYRYGRYWQFADTLTTAPGKNNLNDLLPMGFIFKTPEDADLEVRVNGLNWIKANGNLIEETEFGPEELDDDATTYVWVDDAGALQTSTVGFPDPTLNEFFLCGIVVTLDGEVSEVKHLGMPSRVNGSGGTVDGATRQKRFTGTAAQTVFTLDEDVFNAQSVLVFYEGVALRQTVDYTVGGAGNRTITFQASAPAVELNDEIEIYYQKV